MSRFDPLAVMRRLDERGVRFVVIGGLAGRLHGSPSITRDLDICYDRAQENLERLAIALRELGAALRGVDDPVPFQLDARTLREGDHFTLATAAGPLDILGTPAGVSGYEELRRNAVLMDLGGDLEVAVAAIEDLIAMKQAAGRPKDRIEVEVLGALLEEIEATDMEASS